MGVYEACTVHTVYNHVWFQSKQQIPKHLPPLQLYIQFPCLVFIVKPTLQVLVVGVPYLVKIRHWMRDLLVYTVVFL